MRRTLSAVPNALFSGGWAVLTVVVLLVLVEFADLTMESPAVFCALILLGPVVSAAFCTEFTGVVLGAVGLGAGLLVIGLISALFFADLIYWPTVLILVPFVSFADLIMGVALWWFVRRPRPASTRVASTP